ncbi:MAG: ABC transporter permease [Bacteroidales bacterium]|nr:ABC transporter permease [Bacteroidales bacterium]
MDILNLIRISAKALLRNKTRSALSMLGIVIGIASVIAVVNLGEGLKQSTANQLSDMGTNLIMVMRANQRRGGISMGSTNVQSLKVSDCDLIAKGAKNITKVSPVVNSAGQLVNGAKNWSGTVYGGTPEYLDIRKYEIATGVNFTDEDVKKYAKVGLIGQTIVEELFDDGEDPIGKTIRIGNMPFRVIGTLKERGENSMGMDQDDLVIMPYSTVQKRMLGVNYIQQIVCSAASEDVAEAAVSEIEEILRVAHKIQEGAANDFEVRTQQEMLEMMTSMTSMITTVLIAIALISLLVGVIGIMNIMYVTVTERTKEIGLRMSIGAKNAAILMQFLTESIILSLIGGVIGLLLGLALSYVVAMAMSLPFVVNVMWMIISFVSCAILGLIAGFFPALKASRTDPINALRYE